MRRVILPLFALGLSGCAMFQSNVKGAFACAAARGTCAPSTAIDDSALRAIDGHAAERDAPASPALEPLDAGARAVSADTENGLVRGALKVVYPAWRDGSGHVHKGTVAYVNVAAPGLVAAGGAMRITDSPAGTNLLAVAESAPHLALVSPSPASPLTHEAPTTAQTSAPIATTPLGTIQAQVRDILAKAPKPTIKAVVPGILPPSSPATTGGTFPPQGK